MTRSIFRAPLRALLIGVAVAGAAAPALAQDYRDDGYREAPYQGDADRDGRYQDDRYQDDRYQNDRYQNDRYRDDRYRDDRNEDDRYQSQRDQGGEDILVYGRYRQRDRDQTSLSQHVSYADLDLRYSEDRRILRQRVSLTARYLCDRLGESSTSSSLIPSCRDVATRDALRRVGTIEAHWAPRGTGWVPQSRWQSPYPASWDGYNRR